MWISCFSQALPLDGRDALQCDGQAPFPMKGVQAPEMCQCNAVACMHACSQVPFR